MAGQTFTPNPSIFGIDGTTVSVDSPAVTISGTVISLGQNGAMEIGSSTVSLLTLSDICPSKTYTVAGQTFTPNPSTFSIAGTTVSAGGPAITADGIVVSLAQSGVLAVDSSTIPLPTQSPTPDELYTTAGQKISLRFCHSRYHRLRGRACRHRRRNNHQSPTPRDPTHRLAHDPALDDDEDAAADISVIGYRYQRVRRQSRVFFHCHRRWEDTSYRCSWRHSFRRRRKRRRSRQSGGRRCDVGYSGDRVVCIADNGAISS